MKESVLAESVKAALNGKRIRAALFLTFNFDALFFENYILPLCMDPNLEFGASAAKNALLWLRHGNELPPVTVICDYYAKNNAEPPRLDYDVVCVAMEKSFFHPKNIFLLCDDGELLFLAGSANMSYSGWCHNIETMSMITFRGDANQDEAAGEVRNYLDHIRGLVAAHTADSAIPEAFNTIRRYFRNARAADPKNPALAFHHSTNGSFSDFLESLREKHNRRQPFETIEIVSPYLSQDASAEQYGRLAAMAANGVDLALPWSKPGQAGLARTLYDALPKKGYRWRSLSAGGGNQFRFAHGKAYRFKGEEKMITVVGSVNFTRQGFARFGGEGPEAANIETAVAIVEPVDRWTSIFSDQSPAPVSFSTQDELALDVSARVEIPPLFFTLDWGEKKLFYRYGEKWKEPCRLNRVALCPLGRRCLLCKLG